MDDIARDGGQRREAMSQQLEDGAGHEHERSALHVTRRYATANWRPTKFLRTTPVRSRQLISKLAIECLEPVGQFYDSPAVVVQYCNAVINVLPLRRLNKRMIQ